MAFSKIVGLAEDARAVDAGVDADQLAVDLARVDRSFDELGDVRAVRLQIQQRAPGAVLGDVGHVHLDDVRSLVAGRLGRELVPVGGELARLRRDRHRGVGRHVRGDRLVGVRVANGVAPPGERHVGPAALAAATAAGVRATGGQAPRGRGGEPGSNQELPARYRHALSLRP